MPPNLHMLNIFCTFAVDLDGKEMTRNLPKPS